MRLRSDMCFSPSDNADPGDDEYRRARWCSVAWNAANCHDCHQTRLYSYSPPPPTSQIPVGMPAARGSFRFGPVRSTSGALWGGTQSWYARAGLLHWGISPVPTKRQKQLALSCLYSHHPQRKRKRALRALLSVYLSCVCCFLANEPNETSACRREASALTVQCLPRHSLDD